MNFQLRIFQIASSRALGQIHVKGNLFSIKDRSNNELWSSRLDSNQICRCFNSKSIKWWALKLQVGCMSNLIHRELRTNKMLSSRAPGWIHFFINFQLRIIQILSCRALGWIHIKVDLLSMKNQSNNKLSTSGLDSYQIW